MIAIGGIVKGKDVGLPLKASLSYNYNGTSTYWIIYVSQCLSLYCGAFVTIGTETFVMAMMIQICSQLDIIYHRLESLPNLHKIDEKSIMFRETDEDKMIKECVLHHNYIFK